MRLSVLAVTDNCEIHVGAGIWVLGHVEEQLVSLTNEQSLWNK